MRMFVAERIGDLAKEHAMGTELTAEMCVVALEPDNSANTKIRDFVTRKLGIKAQDFDRALRATKVIKRFGRYPKSASDLVDLLAKELRLKVRYNGRINQDAVPFLDGLIHEDYARKPAFIPPDEEDDPAFKMYVQNRFKDDMEYHQFRRKVRVVAKETSLPWRPSDLNDACDQSVRRAEARSAVAALRGNRILVLAFHKTEGRRCFTSPRNHLLR